MKKAILLTVSLALALSACGFGGRPSFGQTPGAGQATVEPSATEAPTDTPTPLPPSETPVPPPSVTPTSVIYPSLTVIKETACREGPHIRYNRTGQLLFVGKSYTANGRNEDNTWLSVQALGVESTCWVPLTTFQEPGDLSALHVLLVQPLPNAPINLRASDNACGLMNTVWLYWYAEDPMGYRIYRNGHNIATVYGGQFRDLDTPRDKRPTVYLYEIEAFNASGISERSSISVTICG